MLLFLVFVILLHPSLAPVTPSSSPATAVSSCILEEGSSGDYLSETTGEGRGSICSEEG